MSAPHQVVLTHTVDELPEALRDAALAYLAQVTGHTPAQIADLLQQLPAVVARVADAEAAQSLQAQLARAGWRTELRIAPPPPPPKPQAQPMREQAPVQVDKPQAVNKPLPMPADLSTSASIPTSAIPPSTKSCPDCHHINASSARFCAECGEPLALGSPLKRDTGVVGSAANAVAGMAGLGGAHRFNMGDLLSEVFSKRSEREIEDYVTVGTLGTTPAITEVNPDWPKPWLYARVLLGALLLAGVFYVMWVFFQNINVLPGLIIVSCFVTPFVVVVLFYELNVPRNVTLIYTIKLAAWGGGVSLLVTLVVFTFSDQLDSLIGASSAGFVEETSKLAAVLFATRKLSTVRFRYVLNGLLFGAAVGAGFAAFESAGYALNTLLKSKDAGMMMGNIVTRGWMAPFGHVVWTALAAGALWRVKGAKRYDGTMLADPRFLRVFVVSVLCHIIWNASIVPPGPFMIKYWILGAVAWAVALSLVQEGLQQVQREQLSLT